MKKIITLLLILMPLIALAIDVKIENPRIELNKPSNQGDAILAKCKLTVTGIKGKDFQLAALVKDDTGNWHKTQYDETCWVFEPLNSPYESSVWEEVGLFIPNSLLNPKPGKHNYEVWLYVYYNKEWYGGVKAGSYSHTGASTQSSSSGSNSSSSSSSSSHSHSHSDSQSQSTTYTCNVCNGSGLTTCYLCAGLGGSNQLRSMTVPPYKTFYQWVTCMGCQGHGKVTCPGCLGKGQVTLQNNYNSGGSYSGGGYTGGGYSGGNSNSSSGSSAYTKCRICGGSGTCTSCHGTGGEWKSYGYYTGEATKTWVECPSCHGKKTCFNCYGTGRQ